MTPLLSTSHPPSNTSRNTTNFNITIVVSSLTLPTPTLISYFLQISLCFLFLMWPFFSSVAFFYNAEERWLPEWDISLWSVPWFYYFGSLPLKPVSKKKKSKKKKEKKINKFFKKILKGKKGEKDTEKVKRSKEKVIEKYKESCFKTKPKKCACYTWFTMSACMSVCVRVCVCHLLFNDVQLP